jgi:hypothetical protein
MCSVRLGAQAPNANKALVKPTADPAALDDTARAFTQVDLIGGNRNAWMTTAGLRLGGGTIFGSYAWTTVDRAYGLGYARPIAQRDLGFLGSIGTGLDLYGAYDIDKWTGYNERAVRLAIPLSIRWGSPSRLSLSPFIAPYAELGRAGLEQGDCVYTAPSCTNPYRVGPGQTREAGLGAGAELTAWHVSLNFGLRNLWMRRDALYSDQASLGIRVRF